MKVLFFIESLHSGGKERRLVELIKGLRRLPNFECELVLTKKEIHYKDIWDTGVKIHVIERKILKKDPRLFFLFFGIAQRFRPDVIHVWGNLVAFYAILAKLLLRIPMINNQITDAFGTSKSAILNHNLTFHFSDAVVANSEAGLQAYNAPPEKSHVIYNGFNFQRISNLVSIKEIKKKFKIATQYIVGMAATFSKYKDYKSYLEAANIVLKKNKDITFVCIGAGDTHDCHEMVNIENREHVRFLGRQENVESILNICDVGVLSTYTEGISNALLEFMALGKPVVATDGGGTKELVIDGDTGFLVPAQSPEMLADKILFFLNNLQEVKKFGENGLKRIQDNFNIEDMVEKYKKLYSETAH